MGKRWLFPPIVVVVSLILAASLVPGGGQVVSAAAPMRLLAQAAPPAPGTVLAPPAIRPRVGGQAAKQLITIASSRYAGSDAVATAWNWRKGSWHVAYGPWSARIGYAGFSRLGVNRRLQNTGTTPVGIFSLTQAFGIKPNPGTTMPWHQVTASSWWPYDPADPATYNLLQTSRPKAAKWRTSGDHSEHLIDYGTQYAYAVVINFNIPLTSYLSGGQLLTNTPADTSAGGGIFLHVNGSGATAGCVSLRKRHVKLLLNWLRPGKNPQIAMGPTKALSSLGAPML